MKVLLQGYRNLLLCLVSFNYCEINLQFCALHPRYKHGIHCNPIMSFLHSVRFPCASQTIDIMSPHCVRSLAEPFRFGWPIPQSQELSIFLCHIMEFFDLCHPKHFAIFLCSSWFCNKITNVNIHVRIKIEPSLVLHTYCIQNQFY